MPKVSKQKNDKKAIHPNSRKAARLTKTAERGEKLSRNKNERINMVKATVGETVSWFKDKLDPEKSSYSVSDACDLIDCFLQRFDNELHKLSVRDSIKGRQKRHNAREEAIQMTMEHERRLFDTSGLEIPDITNGKNLQILRSWDEDLRSINTIKMKKFTSQDRLKHEKRTSEKNKEEKNIEMCVD